MHAKKFHGKHIAQANIVIHVKHTWRCDVNGENYEWALKSIEYLSI